MSAEQSTFNLLLQGAAIGTSAVAGRCIAISPNSIAKHGKAPILTTLVAYMVNKSLDINSSVTDLLMRSAVTGIATGLTANTLIDEAGPTSIKNLGITAAVGAGSHFFAQRYVRA